MHQATVYASMEIEQTEKNRIYAIQERNEKGWAWKMEDRKTERERER